MTSKEIFNILETVSDPEIPVLTIADLGILQKAEIDENTGKAISLMTSTNL